MATHSPCPVDVWAPAFLTFVGGGIKFNDAWLMRAENVLHPYSDRGTSRMWCTLCDAPVPGEELPERHHARHIQELRDWRTAHHDKTERRREIARAEAGPDSSVPLERQLRNYTKSLRWRLRHPERYGREFWTSGEIIEMERKIKEAQLRRSV